MNGSEPSSVLLPRSWAVPEEYRHRLGTSVGRQRLMQADGHLLLVLHAVPEANDSSRDGRLFWRDAAGQWSSSVGDEGIQGLWGHLDAYAAAVDKCEELETEAMRADQYMMLLENLSPLLRAARNMLQVTEEARKAVREDRELIDIRDKAYEISRTAELLYNDAKNAMDVAVVRRAEEQAESGRRMALASHRLNVLVAMFFPVATLAAVFSTVFTEGWPLSNSPVPFVAFLGFGLLSGLILTWFITREG